MIPSIPSTNLLIETTTLTQSAFAPFGNVIECPLPPSTSIIPSPLPESPTVVPANQSTALKYLDVTHMRNLYDSAPSKIPSKPVMNMFSCFPRSLRHPKTKPSTVVFDVEILERHPYTTQTFIPLSSPPPESLGQSKYLVIVAPILPPEPNSPFETLGPPDLHHLQAFWGHSGQGVTYGAGTWHAPMVVIGDTRIDFVVVQFANGVGDEDCQEVRLEGTREGEYLNVNVGDKGNAGRSKL